MGMDTSAVSNVQGTTAVNENVDSSRQIEVRFGDTPESLAEANGITPQALQDANPDMTAVVYPGQTLLLPKAEANSVTSTGLQLGAQPASLADRGNAAKETIGVAPAIKIEQGEQNFNRIQVDNPTNTPALTKLNQKLDDIYQTNYVKPMKKVIDSSTMGTGTTGGAGNPDQGYLKDALLRGQVDFITRDYQFRVAQELQTAQQQVLESRSA